MSNIVEKLKELDKLSQYDEIKSDIEESNNSLLISENNDFINNDPLLN